MTISSSSGKAHLHPDVLVIANPSADVYGSDLQMLETVSAMVEEGWRVVVTTPDTGPLIDLLVERGAEVCRIKYPVVRRENTSLKGFLRLARDTALALPRLCKQVHSFDPSAVYVNTVTIPFWLLAARLMGRPVVCHVHEAERQDGWLVTIALNAPLLFSNRLIVISKASMEALVGAIPWLRSRATLIYNGVPGPEMQPLPSNSSRAEPRRLAIIGRLSPRKGTDVALDVLSHLRTEGRNVVLTVCGTAFPGYEWFVEKLHNRADQPDIRGAVEFLGYVRPVWPVLEDADIVLAPSLREPFGNAVVECQLAERPVVASRAMGHLETIEDGQTGLLVPAGDAKAMAQAVSKLLDDPSLAERIAHHGRENAEQRFSIDRYRHDVAALLDQIKRPRRANRVRPQGERG